MSPTCLPACLCPCSLACGSALLRSIVPACLPAGLKAQLAAVQQVHNQSGEFAAWLGKGSSAVQELQRQLHEAERSMVLLKETSLKPLIQEVAELNGCHIVVVSGARGREGGAILVGDV